MKKIFFLFFCFTLLLKAANPIATIKTNSGEMKLELRPDIAPKAVENFITHAKNGYYDGIIFHRVIKNFMIQGGDPTGTGRGGESIWGKPFKNEYAPNLTFDKAGILAMANAGPDTNGSQFFITTVPTPWLNGGYTIFGFLKDGMKTLKTIENTPTTGRNGGDRPIIEQKIVSITIE